MEFKLTREQDFVRQMVREFEKENKMDFTCSKCNHIWNIMNNECETFYYCPNCGAKMLKGTEE